MAIKVGTRVRITNGGYVSQLDNQTGTVYGIGDMCGFPQYSIELDNPVMFEGEEVPIYTTEAINLEEILTMSEMMLMSDSEPGNCLGCGTELFLADLVENKHGCFDQVDGNGKATLCPVCKHCANCDESEPKLIHNQ